ncbi:MAG: helix-turn-helix transcriptional regulator [Lachnospiraceae bacterium]|nr:helix-turn-helix transcriptional regulator [Lachnospiraceae bacterium]
MLLNNIEMDIKKKCVKARTTQKEIARRIDVSPPYVNHITKNREQIVNKTFLKIMDALGYDVELIYKKKNTENDSSIQSK